MTTNSITDTVTYSHAENQIASALTYCRSECATMELQMLSAAAETIERLTRQAVNAARQDGESWAAIGSRLGITKQAAQQKYGRKPAPKPSTEPTLPLD